MSAGGFEEFVAPRATLLLRTAYRLTGGRRAARDLLQAALVAGRRHWDPALDEAAATALLRRELVAAHVGWASRVHVGGLIADSPLLAGTRGLPGFGHQPPDVGPRDELSVALSQLPPRLRAVLVLRYGEGLPDADTADALGTAVAEVPQQADLALARLHASFAGSAGGSTTGDLAERLRRELSARGDDVTADPEDYLALVREGTRARRHHLAGLLAVVGFVVLVVLLVVITV
ncbi:sigma factor-like helix-turn-helix DNA-binding protein [Modestobacter versicolor]|uniref:DNA-directed RNA polymerase specialized sigma24 family protein n=1 Tax=Modestobacter versicolor TaxID=429133 RepID=A0A839Y4E1_9ACTN|nr:sigma factor-like helix-turn-helix DNA-binding protein [Modestobacter versicolor]MBB3677615.1 DNA-directed RNA polymerase specialized sigma24 family protein [Modestobacter versicolor]